MKKLLLLLIVSIAVTATACLHIVESYQGKPDGVKVAVTGDSITAQSCPSIHARLNTNYQVACFATTGLDTYQKSAGIFLDDVDRAAATDPSVVVILLGSNDGRSYEVDDPAYSVEKVSQNLADLRAKFSHCVVVVTLNENVTNWGPDTAKFITFAKAVNSSLPKDHVIDLSAAIASHPNYTAGDVHLTPEGQAGYAALIEEAVHGCGF